MQEGPSVGEETVVIFWGGKGGGGKGGGGSGEGDGGDEGGGCGFV